MRKASCFGSVEPVLVGFDRSKIFFENAVFARFASKFHSVLSQSFFKSVLGYVEVCFRHELRRKFNKT